MIKVRTIQIAVAVFGALSVVFMYDQIPAMSIRQSLPTGVLVVVPYVIYVSICRLLTFRTALLGALALTLPVLLLSLKMIVDANPYFILAYLVFVLPYQGLVLLIAFVIGMSISQS